MWDWVWERYIASINANEKSLILNSLACSSEVWVLARYLDMALDEASGVRKQGGHRGQQEHRGPLPGLELDQGKVGPDQQP